MPAIVGFLGHLGPRNTQMCLATVPTNTWLCHVHRYIEEERMHWVYWSANFSRHQHQTTRANTQIKVPGPQFVQPWNEGIVHTEQSSAVLPVFSFYVRVHIPTKHFPPVVSHVLKVRSWKIHEFRARACFSRCPLQGLLQTSGLHTIVQLHYAQGHPATGGTVA